MDSGAAVSNRHYSEKKKQGSIRGHKGNGAKSVEPRSVMNTIPLESIGNESTAQNLGPDTVTESIDTTTIFDTKKWKKMINGNVTMIQQKVDQSTPHHVLYRELDDLKMIVSNCFDQLSRSLGR